jgi:phosphopantetheine--protein transferase-like protein
MINEFKVYSKINSQSENFATGNLKSQINLFYGDSLAFQNIVAELVTLLSEKEVERMEKFLFIKGKHCYLVVHALLKRYLSDKFKHKGQIDINYFNNIKPYIEGIDIDFNISHSEQFFSFIIADKPKLRVGIDIEKIKAINEIESISKNYFSENEYEYIFQPNINNLEQLYRFYEVWTCKEAFLKMIGLGLYADLRNINVLPGINNINLELPEKLNNTNPLAYIYSKRFEDYIISVSLSEERAIHYQKIIS